VAAPSQRRSLGALFLVLSAVFAGIAFGAAYAHAWVIAAAAAAIAVWFVGLTVRMLRTR
jgi:hypothetical protein